LVLCISSSRVSEGVSGFVLLKSSECIVLNTPKGLNRTRERHPSLRCPVCKKILGAFDTPRDKNCTLVYDADDPRMKEFPHSHLRKCPRCHRAIGIAVLEDRTEELFRQSEERRAAV